MMGTISMTKRMAGEFSPGQMGGGMKGSGRMGSSMEKE